MENSPAGINQATYDLNDMMNPLVNAVRLLSEAEKLIAESDSEQPTTLSAQINDAVAVFERVVSINECHGYLWPMTIADANKIAEDESSANGVQNKKLLVDHLMLLNALYAEPEA